VREGGHHGAAARVDLFSQQHAAITAVRIVAVHAESLGDLGVLLQFGCFLVASETDLLLWHQQVDGCHVTLGLCQMADGT